MSLMCLKLSAFSNNNTNSTCLGNEKNISLTDTGWVTQCINSRFKNCLCTTIYLFMLDLIEKFSMFGFDWENLD